MNNLLIIILIFNIIISKKIKRFIEQFYINFKKIIINKYFYIHIINKNKIIYFFINLIQL